MRPLTGAVSGFEHERGHATAFDGDQTREATSLGGAPPTLGIDPEP
jgi:hypothetical protein